MTRRRSPRPLAAALEGFTSAQAPQTLLAQIQAHWPGVVGRVVAEEARPVSERDGTLTVTCRTAAWANELELLAPELLEKLNGALGGPSDGPVRRLRAKVAAPG